ncbi:isochorismate synthase [Amycolatopsis taiwanensis]|uniref:isochorismate synthase n=1 Tax=Amycolatopsis taiwanensis TaxID=342230 RepID=UPI0004AF4272|nr:chorismate-binding protein [Amycolatopsis taiwanensis]
MENSLQFRFDNAETGFRVDGGDTTFGSLEDAVSWLHDTAVPNPVVAGLIPYEHGGCSLFGASKDEIESGPRRAVTSRPPTRFHYDVRFNTVEAERYLTALENALGSLQDPSSELRKVVLSRVERYIFQGDFPVGDCYDFMNTSYPTGNNFCVRNIQRDGCYHLGSSPELFLSRQGRRIALHPLAGTLSKDSSRSPEDDRRRAENLFSAAKFRDEHAYLVDFLREALAGFCESLVVPPDPEIVSASHVWHLGTPIEGVLKSPDIGLAKMLDVLHPSPAVCGVPRSAANEFIAEHEGRRGYYAGLVGWFDDRANCELYLALRGMEVDLAAGHVDLRAGGGIVEESSIPLEFGEAGAKMSTMQKVLGIEAGPAAAAWGSDDSAGTDSRGPVTVGGAGAGR